MPHHTVKILSTEKFLVAISISSCFSCASLSFVDRVCKSLNIIIQSISVILYKNKTQATSLQETVHIYTIYNVKSTPTCV
ncbi:hypothetical protein L873DRAFT_629795 [Choiromyces venosus 120613-1]|uniref:Uncharacterized protein n=1 Tax=Choiromyces venosus 120613-1 TaxID=1336337 RepID=A0A3N4K6J1_9PEZI|nr:hypothetical protein L873DRAFT_629795 [Choiromyces venosus 120613-1]